MAWRRAGCALPPPASCRSSSRREAGFTLLEVLVAMGLFTVAMLAIAQLLAASVQMHQLGRNTDAATQLAQSKLDELMKMNFDTAAAVQVTPGGADSLAANVANYFDVPAGNQYTRRWRVQAGPVPRTRVVTVRVQPSQVSRRTYRPVEVTTILRQW